MSEDISTNLQSLILGLSFSLEDESNKENKKLIEELKRRYKENEELYMAEVDLAALDFSRIVSIPYLETHEIKDTENSWIIEYLYNGLFSHYITRYLEKNEGSSCSGDKESFIISGILKSIEIGANIALYQTYAGINSIPKENWNERAYWSPATIPDTRTVIKMFSDWLNLV